MATKRRAVARRWYPRSFRRGGKRKFTIPLAIVAGLAPGVIDVVQNGMSNGVVYSSKNSPNNAMAVFLRDFTGIQTGETQQAYNTGSWNAWALKYGLYPALGGFAAHFIAQKVGLNRMLANAGVPLIRI